MTILRDRLSLFPDSATIQHDSLKIAGHDLLVLAATYGTPLYIYDRATLDACIIRFREALKGHYAAASVITYAAKAFLCKALAQWAEQEKLWLDCTCAGEVAVVWLEKGRAYLIRRRETLDDLLERDLSIT